MATKTVPKLPSSPTVDDRMSLAKKANEEICALIATCKDLHEVKQLDDLQRQIVMRGMMARIEQLADIAWSVLADTPDDFEDKSAQVEFLGPL